MSARVARAGHTPKAQPVLASTSTAAAGARHNTSIVGATAMEPDHTYFSADRAPKVMLPTRESWTEECDMTWADRAVWASWRPSFLRSETYLRMYIRWSRQVCYKDSDARSIATTRVLGRYSPEFAADRQSVLTNTRSNVAAARPGPDCDAAGEQCLMAGNAADVAEQNPVAGDAGGVASAWR